MATVAVTRLVAASVDELWRILTDLPARAGWLSAVARVEVLTPGPLRAGTVWREGRRLPDGAELIEELRVDELSAPHRLTLVSAAVAATRPTPTAGHAGAESRTSYAFTPVDWRRHRADRTAVSVVRAGTADAGYARLLADAFGGVSARTVGCALRRDLTDLAVAVASSTAPGPTGSVAGPGVPG